MMRIAIVEDDAVCFERLQAFLSRFETENDVKFNIFHYKTGKDFIDNSEGNLDIVFMDIEMPEMDGMTASKLLRTKDDDVVLIFITRMAQYAINGYEVNASDFIVKPINYPSFSVKLKKAINKRKTHYERKIQVNTPDGVIWLAVSSIRYVDVIGHDLTYYTELEKFTERASMYELEETLKDCGFCRCSRYYLINMRYVTGIYDDYVLIGNEKIPISRRKKKFLIQQLLTYNAGGG